MKANRLVRVSVPSLVAGIGFFAARRQILARALGLTPVEFQIGVEHDLSVRMPDGVTLYADHYFPRAQGRFPTILIRTPYGRGGESVPQGWVSWFVARRFAERGYHVVVQTTRGRYDSEGVFEPFVNEAADGRATLDWVSNQPWFNGNLGTWGYSYLGYAQWAVGHDAPTFLKAMVPSITTSRFSTIVDPVFALNNILRWTWGLKTRGLSGRHSLWDWLKQTFVANENRMVSRGFAHLPIAETDTAALGQPISFYQKWLAHPDSNDEYWQAIDQRRNLARITAPVHLVSGWHDLLLRELVDDYETLKESGHPPYLTIGPWQHTDRGVMLAALREGIIWSDAHLKNKRGRLRAKPVRLFVMGANEWRDYESFPPPSFEGAYFLGAQGVLSADPPDTGVMADEYVFDPAHPTPALGGLMFGPLGGVHDQRPLQGRSDVLTYSTAPLEQDVEIIGHPRVTCYVRSSARHTDFFVRVADASPDGGSINVADGMVRVRDRDEDDWRLEIKMLPTAYRFRKGHRIQLMIASGQHPRWDRNLGTGDYWHSNASGVVQRQAIFHDAGRASVLILPVIE